MSRWHAPEDRVYVRDVHYEWLPAVVEEVRDDQVRVRIELPDEWNATTLRHPNDAYNQSLPQQQRWVNLRGDDGLYRLPLQNSICRDMAALQHVNEAEILYQIKKRHCLADMPYTRVGDIIVAMNPCRWIHSLYTIDQQNFYFEHFAQPQSAMTDTPTEEKKEAFIDAATVECCGSEYDRLGCEPHIYEVSALALRGLVEQKMNQTILVSGESGSGKTETVKMVLQHLARRRPRATGRARSYDDDLIAHVLASSPIFEAFGNAKTMCNANSSRFGKVTQLHFDRNSAAAPLMGSSFAVYLLELNRVVSHVAGERNFHIFYQMLAAPSAVKNDLLGPDWREATPADFRYLNRCPCGIKDEMLDASNWTYTLKALIMFGWDGGALEHLMRALGIILLIGNIEFQEVNGNKASIAQEADLFMLSASLGVQVEELELALTQRTIQTAQDLLLVPFSPDQANEACEALSKTLYAGVVASIVRQINYLTSVPSSIQGNQNSIALVDIFGFENFVTNRFDQFCINYANERLQQKYIFDNLSRHMYEYQLEGIVLPDWKDIDNSSTVNLFEGTSGLIKKLNEQCVLPNGTSDIFVSIVKQLNKSHERFLFDNLHSNTEFGVHHFAGPVIYDASKFVERNTEKLPDFLISVVATSTNALLSQELGEVMKERAFSSNVKRKLYKRSVIDVFQTQLKELLSSIEGSQSRYIRCIKPCNDLEVTKTIDHQAVIRQLRCSGLVAAIQLSRETFPNKLLFSTVARRFSCLLSSTTLTSIEDMDVHDRAQVILSSVFSPLIEACQESAFSMPFACGRTKVFFRAGALEILERKRHETFSKFAGKIQNIVRGFICERKYRHLRTECIRLQTRIRCLITYIKYKKTKQLVGKVQARVRTAAMRKRFLKLKGFVICIQRWWAAVRLQQQKERQVSQMRTGSATQISRWCRAILLSRWRKVRHKHALVISSWIRARQQRASFLRMKRAAISIASWNRALPILYRFKKLKMAANIVTCHRHLELASRARKSKVQAVLRIQTLFRSRQQMRRYVKMQKDFKMKQRHDQEHRAVTKIQSFVRSKQRVLRKRASCFHSQEVIRSNSFEVEIIAGSSTSDEIIDSTTVVTENRIHADSKKDAAMTPYHLEEQLVLYKRQIDELRSDITLLTSEAELHKQEVEAEFEERLAEYEQEVLQLKQLIRSHEEEKINLKDEIAANVMIVGNLKTGIRSMQEAHRDYLNKVMRAIENANVEHQRALELLKQDRDDKVDALSQEIENLKERLTPNGLQLDRRDFASIYELARKIEKLTAPHFVATLGKKTRKLASKEDYIEEKLSGKVRQLLYRIEDIVAKPSHEPAKEKEYILSLQEQLVDANNEIGRLQTLVSSSSIRKDQAGRLGLKKLFER